MASEVKLLLLGAGESGKSTIVRQLALIHKGPLDDKARKDHAKIVFRNVLHSAQQLVFGVNRLGLTPSREDFQELSDEVTAIQDPEEIESLSERLDLAANIWSDDAVQDAWNNHRSQFQVNDSTAYFLNKLDEIKDPDYIPSTSDILYTRVRTTGITEVKFKFDNYFFTIVDVGGQRNERKKWIHCFEGVTAVIFVVAISEFDQMLFEDESVSRIEESLLLFREICNSKWFHQTSIILFLNKTDVFVEKIGSGPGISQVFEEYTGPNEFKQSAKYIASLFYAQNSNPDKDIYTHFTCATDSTSIQIAFDDLKDILLKGDLLRAGFM